MTAPAVTETEALAGLYKGLGAASEHPTSDLILRSRSNPLLVGLAVAAEVTGRPELQALFDELWGQLASRGSGERLLKLRVEHCRLFQGPPSPVVSPYEGSHVSGGAPGGAARDVGRRYRSAGASVSGAVRDREDHVAAEVEFLGALCEAESGAPESRVRLAPGAAREARGEFLRDHASRWLAGFAEQVRDGALDEFYRIYARALDAAIRWDQEGFPETADVQEATGQGG